MGMSTATVAEVGRTPGAILSRAEPSIITNNGRAQNVIVNVSGLDIDEVVDLARSFQAQAALMAMGDAARRAGVEGMGQNEIDREVASARASRQAIAG